MAEPEPAGTGNVSVLIVGAGPVGLGLVRPDGHVAWRDDAVPAEPATLIDRVRGAQDG